MGIFSEMTETDHEQLVFCYDLVSGLKAIIGIHDTTLGPALGGTRMWFMLVKKTPSRMSCA